MKPRNIEIGLHKKRLAELRAKIPNLTEEEMLEADAIEERIRQLNGAKK